MKAIISPSYRAIHSHRRFHWDGFGKIATAEISELSHDQPAVFGPIYNDAADLGFGVYSDATDRTTVWTVWREERDKEEDEVLYWVLKPTSETIKAIPRLEGWEMHVFND